MPRTQNEKKTIEWFSRKVCLKGNNEKCGICLVRVSLHFVKSHGSYKHKQIAQLFW